MTTAKKAAAKKTAAKKAVKKTAGVPAKAKDPKGGLTKAGRMFFNERDGSHLKPGVTGAADTPEKMKRKGSFLTRHFTHPRGPMVKDGEPTRLALSAHDWGEPVPKTEDEAKKLAEKGRELLEKYHAAKEKGVPRKATVKKLFFLMHGPICDGKLAGVVYGYFDGSQATANIDAQPRSFCGLIGNETEWTKIDTGWRAVLDSPVWPNRPKRFHAFDCVNAIGDFRGWRYSLRLTLYAELMNLLIDADVLPCGVAMLPNAFTDLPWWIRATFGSPDLLMMQHAIQTTLSQAKHRWPLEDVGLVFDQGNKKESVQAHYLFERLPRIDKWNKWVSFALGDSTKLSMLQAADMMAYGTYRYHHEQLDRSGIERDFRISPIMQRMVERMPSTGQAWDRNSLMDIFVKGANFVWPVNPPNMPTL